MFQYILFPGNFIKYHSGFQLLFCFLDEFIHQFFLCSTCSFIILFKIFSIISQLPYFSGWRFVPGRFRLQNESLFSCFPSVSPPAGSHSSWFFPRTGFLWIPQSGVRSYRHISSIRLSGWNYPPLQALSNARTDALSDRSADWTEAPSDSTRSFSYALFSDGTPPRSFLSRSRTGTASNGGGFLLPVLFPGRQSDVHTGAPSDLLSHTPPPRMT